jgi:hypothetical protein
VETDLQFVVLFDLSISLRSSIGRLRHFEFGYEISTDLVNVEMIVWWRAALRLGMMETVMARIKTPSVMINLWVDVKDKAALIEVVSELPALFEHQLRLCTEAVGDSDSRQYTVE